MQAAKTFANIWVHIERVWIFLFVLCTVTFFLTNTPEKKTSKRTGQGTTQPMCAIKIKLCCSKEKQPSYPVRKLRFGFCQFLFQWAGDVAAAAWTHTRCNLSIYVRLHRERRWRTSWHRNPGTKQCSSAHQDWENRLCLLQGEKKCHFCFCNIPQNEFQTLIDKQQERRWRCWPGPGEFGSCCSRSSILRSSNWAKGVRECRI